MVYISVIKILIIENQNIFISGITKEKKINIKWELNKI